MPSGCRVVFTGPDEVVLEPQEFGAPKAGQVLLQSEKSLISTGTELNLLTGQFRNQATRSNQVGYPSGSGYSNVATVLEVGEGVTAIAPGDRVMSGAAHATHALYPADRVWKVPDPVTSEAATFGRLAAIAMGGLRRGRLAFGESVAIVGAGLLGQLSAHIGHAAGALPIVVVDTAAERLRTALSLGATGAVSQASDDAAEEVRRLTSGGADLVIEATGNPSAIPGALKLARKMGRVVLLGSPRGITTVDLYGEAHLLSLDILGAHETGHPNHATPQYPWTVAQHVELFLRWQAAGGIDVTPIITHRFPWREAAAAYALLVEDRTRALGVILDWGA